MFEYIIQPGDSLDVIASNFGVTTDMLLAANPGLTPMTAVPTQIIFVPVSTYLYQQFPWYITFPYLFITQPWSFWNNPMRWPAGPWNRPGGGWQGGGWQGGGGGRPGGGPGGGGRGGRSMRASTTPESDDTAV